MLRRSMLCGATAVRLAGLSRGAQAPERGTMRTNRVVARDGTQLFHCDRGQGRAIVFRDSWGLSSAAWSYQTAPPVERGFRYIAFDRRSHGRPDAPGCDYDCGSPVGDLDSVLTQPDTRDATLVAHSFAGGEAVRYLSEYGRSRVSRLLLLAPVHAMPVQRRRQLAATSARGLRCSPRRYLA
jgi:non-heme chloroperoxidase